MNQKYFQIPPNFFAFILEHRTPGFPCRVFAYQLNQEFRGETCIEKEGRREARKFP